MDFDWKYLKLELSCHWAVEDLKLKGSWCSQRLGTEPSYLKLLQPGLEFMSQTSVNLSACTAN